MGGTMTARSHDYQEWFVKRALQAMNDYDLDKEPEPAEGESFAPAPEETEFEYLEDVIAENETNEIRNIGTTFETKPDWCDPEQIDRMLDLGGPRWRSASRPPTSGSTARCTAGTAMRLPATPTATYATPRSRSGST